MHGDQVVPADELVDLQVVHVPAVAGFGCVQDYEHMIGIGVHLRHPVAFGAVLHRKAMKTEDLGEYAYGVGITVRNVHPHEAVV
ncbi:MAG TPA: hypothetical protein VN408_11440 [Actinoplanes sp.]|nr:hypothetical protein [Actinoplanes sp.]